MSNTLVEEKKPQTGPIVMITVDNKPCQIHRGHQSVAEIKSIGGVPQAFELEEVKGGKLVPLPDDSSVTLKGDETFVSHPRDSAAS